MEGGHGLARECSDLALAADRYLNDALIQVPAESRGRHRQGLSGGRGKKCGESLDNYWLSSTIHSLSEFQPSLDPSL